MKKNRPRYLNQKLSDIEPSLSGFVLLLGVPKVYEQLAHHNVFFFPEDYEQEFKDIFFRKNSCLKTRRYTYAIQVIQNQL
ncbi:hypothetical protein BsIDN1_53520 [Bacillus safensis]|uniref:Uncharacterized protein n=1 Tax=Bacillus safensis TaxID=561879 RepID=A0A5S9MHV0_BACIA|nr:hypothetical protein BsIDN1_53520 [Bacillus safensis]